MVLGCGGSSDLWKHACGIVHFFCSWVCAAPVCFCLAPFPCYPTISSDVVCDKASSLYKILSMLKLCLCEQVHTVHNFIPTAGNMNSGFFAFLAYKSALVRGHLNVWRSSLRKYLELFIVHGENMHWFNCWCIVLSRRECTVTGDSLLWLTFWSEMDFSYSESNFSHLHFINCLIARPIPMLKKRTLQDFAIQKWEAVELTSSRKLVSLFCSHNFTCW